jgi:hypothetical protein
MGTARPARTGTAPPRFTAKDAKGAKGEIFHSLREGKFILTELVNRVAKSEKRCAME